MSQARGIVAWLSLSRLLQVYGLDGWPEELIRARLAAVNQVKFSDLGIKTRHLSEFRQTMRYVALCTYQGELCEYSQFFVPGTALALRALAIGDAQAYLFFSYLHGGLADDWELQNGLDSGDPMLQAIVLAKVRDLSTQLRDPTTIDWTPALRQLVLGILLLQGDTNRAFGSSQNRSLIEGYLQDQRGKYVGNSLSYLEGYLKSRYLAGDPLSDDEIALAKQLVLKDTSRYTQPGPWVDTILFANETSSESLMQSATSQIEPELVRLLLKKYPGRKYIPLAYQGGNLSRGRVDRARDLLDLLQNSGRFVESSEAISTLQAVAGQNFAERPDKQAFREIVVAVAHPQLLPTDMEYWSASILNRSQVHYDMVRFASLEQSSTTSTATFVQLYISGHLLELAENRKVQDYLLARLEEKIGPADQISGFSAVRPMRVVTIQGLQLLRAYGAELPPAEELDIPVPGQAALVQAFYGKSLSEQFGPMESAATSLQGRVQEYYLRLTA